MDSSRGSSVGNLSPAASTYIDVSARQGYVLPEGVHGRNPEHYSIVWNSVVPSRTPLAKDLMTHSDDLDRHVPLAPHSFQILLSLLDRELHGYSIIKDIETRTGGEMVLGTSTAYAAIKRMVESGFLEEASSDSDEQSGGPQRKVYRITEWGRDVARAEGLRITRLERMVAEKGLLDPSGVPATGKVAP